MRLIGEVFLIGRQEMVGPADPPLARQFGIEETAALKLSSVTQLIIWQIRRVRRSGSDSIHREWNFRCGGNWVTEFFLR
jgi:hypothetical protein